MEINGLSSGCLLLEVSPVERRVYYLDTNGSLVALQIPPLVVLNATLRVMICSDSPGEFELKVAGATPSRMELNHPGGGWVEAGVVNVSAKTTGNLTVQIVNRVASGAEIVVRATSDLLISPVEVSTDPMPAPPRKSRSP